MRFVETQDLTRASGGQYVWTLTIDGHADEDWRLTFSTRPHGPQSMAA